MWLSQLDLLAFGHFTDVKLPLGPGFHLVYGPNEAGKSTTLRAIRQLLFGFDERTTDNFVHSNPQLRVGGLVCGESGEELEVIRRKARKESLRSAVDDTVIDPDLWRSMLCGIDEDTFSRRYGIDYEQLIQGGREIATGSGDLGEILFASGSGVMDLSLVQKQLNDEAMELFKPQGKKQRLNQALVDWQQQREQVVEKLLSVSSWEETDDQRQQVQIQLKTVTQQWTEKTNAVDQLERQLQALPLIRDLKALELEWNSLKSARPLPTDYVTKRQSALVLLKQAETQEQSLNETQGLVLKQLELLSVPKALLAKVEDLNRLFTDSGSYLKAQIDRPKLVDQCDQHQAALDAFLKALDEPAKGSLLEEAILDRNQRTRVNQLSRRHPGLALALEQAESRHQKLQIRMGEVGAQLADVPRRPPRDGLRRLVRETRVEGDLETQLEQVRNEIAGLQDDAIRLRQQLGLWTGSLSELKSLQIPTPDVIQQADNRFQANLAEQAILRSRLIEFETEHHNLTSQIEDLRREFQVPTESDLGAARENRDLIWARIRQSLLEKVIPPESLLDKFNQAFIETDRLADRLRHEADRVAQFVDQSADLKHNEQRQHETSVRIAELEAARIELETEWKLAWPNLGAVPLSPREMQTWVARREIVLRNEAQRLRRSLEADKLIERISDAVAALSQMLPGETPTRIRQNGESSTVSRVKTATPSDAVAFSQQLSFGWEEEAAVLASGESDVADNVDFDVKLSLSQLLKAAENQLDRDDAIEKRQTDAEETLARLKLEDTECLEQIQRARKDLTEWQISWQSIMAELKLPPDTTPDAASAYVESLLEIMDHQRQARQLRERIVGIDADAERFRSRVDLLCQELAPELSDLPIDQAVSTLRTRLSSGQRDQVRLDELTAHNQRIQQQLHLARDSRIRGEALVAELCQLAGLNPPAAEIDAGRRASLLAEMFQQFAAVEELSLRRQSCEERLNKIRDQLRELAREQPIDQFLDQLQTASADKVSSRLKELEQESSRLAAERDGLNQELGRFDEQLRRMDGSAEAAQAEEQQRQTLAQIRSDAEQYIRVRLAGSVLNTAIARYRERIRGPVLSVASEIFRELTLESFEGLRVDEDDQNRPVLVGLRAGGREAINVGGMSEGTCDQLYLALRLASLRLESAPRRHLPFIVDDILIQFDDARAAAALRVLARLGQQRQVIFFTHHEHLLDIAQNQIPGGQSGKALGGWKYTLFNQILPHSKSVP